MKTLVRIEDVADVAYDKNIDDGDVKLMRKLL